MADMAQLFSALKSTSSSAQTLDAPRDGGQNKTGVWTGAGADETHSTPKSADCFREFKCDTHKNYSSMALIGATCVKGLQDKSELMFSDSHEPNADRVVYSILAFQDLMKKCGMDGVFTIIQRDGTPLNMFQQCGMVTTNMVTKWCSDVYDQGVIDPDNTSTRLPICAHDRTNMLWSGEALLNSCTEALKTQLKGVYASSAQDCNGPKLLQALLQLVYRPSRSKVESLKDDLKCLSLLTFAGENVTEYCKAATEIVLEIGMCYMKPTSTADLVTPALQGLTCASNLHFRLTVEEMMVLHDVDSTPDGEDDEGTDDPNVVIHVLKKLDALYRIKCGNSTYGPALKPSANDKFKALQGAADPQADAGKLMQDRSGKGLSNGQACYACGQTDHLKGDPKCPKYQPNGPPHGRRQGTHGLDDATNSQVSELIKIKLANMPEQKHIPDDAQHTVEINGKVVAKYCRHCGRFGKGTIAHFTKDHKGGRRHCAYQAPPTGAPVPAPAPAGPPLVPAGPPLVPAGGHLAAASTESPPCPPDGALNLADVPSISTQAFLHQEVSYDFGAMSTMEINLASLGLDDDSDEDNSSLLAFFLKAHGG